jgi:putative tryptophan/tyrosine transport system substrate-binding protein
MMRREFIAGLGSVAAWPLVARAQQARAPTVGFLNSASRETYASLISAFVQGLADNGFVEGQNIAIEYRWANGRYDALPMLAADLVQRQVAVIAATGSANAAQAAMSATKTIPIVFANGSDPIKLGLVASLNRPRGNATGVSFFHGGIGGKRLALLHEVVRKDVIGFLVNPENPVTTEDLESAQGMQEIARRLGITLRIMPASTADEISSAFAALAEQQVAAVLVNVDAFYFSRRDQIITLANGYKISALYYERTYAAEGGLMSYGSSNADFYRQAGAYVGLILKGAKPSDLPILLPTKFEFVINLKTAKALGLTIPETLLATADEVIQ